MTRCVLHRHLHTHIPHARSNRRKGKINSTEYINVKENHSNALNAPCYLLISRWGLSSQVVFTGALLTDGKSEG